MKPRVPYTPDIAVHLLNGLAQGHGLRALCRGPGMPTRPTVMRWLKQHAEFGRLAATARAAGGIDGPGRPCGYSDAVIDRIYQRLCQGEVLRGVCRDPALPSRNTIHTWARRRPDIADALNLARDIADWAAADRQWVALGGPDWLRALPSPKPGAAPG